MEGARAAYQRLPTVARRLLVAVLGAAVVAAGLAMLVLPGPGLLTLAAGLAILALEFPWARRMLAGIRARAAETAQKAGWTGPPRRRD
jgi:uncharacterized protein (TIGR02611 family)